MPNLPKVTPEIINAYKEEIAKNGSTSTTKRKEVSIKRFFDWAHAQGKIDENPFGQKPANVSTTAQVTKPKRKAGFKTYATVGLTIGLIILIFLLTRKLQLPIPFITNFAFNGVPESQIQTLQNQNSSGQATNASGSAIPAGSAVIGSWNLFTKLKLMDSTGSPQVGSQTLSFKIYDQATGGKVLYTEGPQAVTTDTNGSALISLDKVPTDLFFQNNQLFLEPEIGGNAATARIPVSTASTPSNLGGYFPANPDTGAVAETVPVVDATGSLNLAGTSPAINSKAGNLLIQGQAVTIRSAAGGNGNIEISPDGFGITHFLFTGNGENFLNAQAPNLTNGSLFYGIVGNNAAGTGYSLIKLQSGSSGTTKFSVDGSGNAFTAGNLNVGGNIQTLGTTRITSGGALTNITGYSQNSGNFVVNQKPGDFASITKSGTALSDVLTLTLDERGKPATSNTGYSTLVLNRYDGSNDAMALLVKNGNAKFNGQLRLGNFAANPDSIGKGSLVFNTTDNKVYVWDGTTWTAVGSGGSSAFSAITSGTNTTAAMVVGSGASLSTSGTGTINATGITCTGCIANTELTNSGITINSGGILTGGGSVSLGGSLTLTATEADTLNSVTTRGATTTNAVTVGNLTDSGLTASKGVFTDASKQLTSTGTLGANQGGTGFSSYAVGDLLYADTTSTLAKLNDVATGNALISGGVGVAPSWGKIVLGTHTTGNYVSTITGTANQITASAATGDVTLSIPSDFRAPGTVNAVSGLYTGATAGTQRIDASGNLTNIGTTQFNSQTYTWPATGGSSGYALTTNGSGTLSWSPASGLGTNYWTLATGAIYPQNNTIDLLVGGDATTSAKFAFKNVLTGIPTASISGNIANVATYLDGNGNLSTTNAQGLTLGSSTTGNVVINSRGSTALTANGANLTAGGTLTLPNSNTLTGATNFVQTSAGYSVGGGTTYYFDSSGNINANAGTFAGNVAVNGGSLTTTQTTGNLFNATATTLNIGGAATTLNLQGASGLTANIGNANGATAINYTSGTGSQTFTSSNATGTTTTSPFVFNDTSITTGDLIYANGGGASFTGNLLKLANNTTAKYILDNAGNSSQSGTLTFGGTATIQSTATRQLTLGGTTTGNIVVSALNDVAGGYVAPNITNVTDLGLSNKIWRNIYGGTIAGTTVTQGGNTVCDTSGNCGGAAGGSKWKESSGAISPYSDTLDVLIGNSATTSAKFAFTGVNAGGTPTASIAGTLANVATYLTGNGTLSTTNMSDLTLGSSLTGNVVIDSRGSTALTANGANLTAGGTLTLPNSITLSGVANYLQSSAGYSVGGATTYYFSGIGDINANSGTFAGNVAVNGANLTTNQTAANLFNTTATTLNIGGAATIVSLGAATGITTINNATTAVTGNLTVAGTTGLTLSGAGAGITFSGTGTHAIANTSAGTDLTLDAGTIGQVKIAGTSTGDILIGGGSGSTGCTITNSTGSLTCAGLGTFGGAFQAGTITSPTAYSRFVTSSTTTTDHGFTTAQDVLVGGGLELNGTLYLDSKTVANPSGTATIILPTDPTTTAGTLTASNWLVENTANLGQAALIVNQTKAGDLFTASSSGTPKFTIQNSGQIWSSTGTFTSAVADGASATGYTFDTVNTLSTAGSKIFSVKNAGTEKFYIDSAGNLYTAGTILSGNGSGILMTNKSGGTVAQKALVVTDSTNNGAFTTTTTPYSKTVYGVVTGVGLGASNDANGNGACDANDNCMVAYGGAVNVTITNTTTVAKGDYVYTSATAGSAVTSSKMFDGVIGVVTDTSTSASGYVKIVFKPQIQVTAAASIDKGSKHNEYWLYANNYTAANQGSDVNSNLLARGLAFDNLMDSTKTDVANTTVSGPAQESNPSAPGAKPAAPFRVGLTGGQTYNSSTKDNDGSANYLGSNTVNKVFYYDRTRDSVPSVLVELGIDPNWYNGVTLNVATTSAQFSKNSTIPYNKNPNLTTSYNGSLIKVTGTSSSAKTIYITIKSPTTFDWTNYNGQAATGVTITPGTAQSLGGTGASVTFTNTNYNVGDVFKIASWVIETSGATRGSKAQFPERSYIVATASSVDIIDADTQKLWMEFQQGTNFALGADLNNNPSSVKGLNGKVYVTENGSAATGFYTLDFVHDMAFRQDATDFRQSDTSLVGRNGTNDYTFINTANILVNITANDVDAVVVCTGNSAQPSSDTLSGRCLTPQQFVGVGTNGGTTLINETTVSRVNSSSTTAVTNVAMVWNSGSATYNSSMYTAIGSSTVNVYTNLSSLAASFTTTATYSTASAPAPAPTSVAINSLAVTSGTSTIDGKSNTIYVGTATNASVIQENQASFTTGSVKYYTKDYISEEMVGSPWGVYSFYNNAANTTVTDSTANGNTGTSARNTSAMSTSGVRGTGYTFVPASNDYISLPSGILAGTSTFSISLWVKPTSASGRYFEFGQAGVWSGPVLIYQSGALKATFNGTDQLMSLNTTPVNGVWSHVVLVRNGSTAYYYLNGKLDTTLSLSGGTPGVTEPCIGAASGASANTCLPVSTTYDGTMDEFTVIKDTALSSSQVKHMYEVGYRALQSHATTLGGGGADTNQQLGFISTGTNAVGDARPDYNNQFMYVGLNSTTLGGLSKIDLNSDTNIKTYNASANVPSGGPLLIDEDVNSLAVGYNLEGVGSAASGVKSMGLDNNATATSGNFVAKTITTAESFNQAYLWAQYVLDSSDASNAIQVWASNDGGSNYYQCNPTNTDTSQTPSEYEYFCQFNSAGNSLKTKFIFARGSTKTNTYVTRYGVAWIGSDAIAGAPGGNGLYTNTNASVANGSYIDVAHNQNSNDVLTNAWVNLNGQWKDVSTATESGVISSSGSVANGSYLELLHNQNTNDVIADAWVASGSAFQRIGDLSTAPAEATSSANTTALWHMNEASGNITDSGSNGYTGTNNGTTVVTGPDQRFGNARNFNGSSNISIAGLTYNYSTGITFETWLKTTVAATSYFMGDITTTTGTQAWITSSGTVSWLGYNSGSAFNPTSTKTVNDGKWHHVALVWDGTTGPNAAKIYIDGILDAQATSTSTWTTAQCAMNLGATRATACTVNTSQFTGTMDEVHILNRVLGPGEIQQQYLNGIANYVLTQPDNNRIRLYNYSGFTQNLRLDMATQAFQVKQVDANTVRLYNYSGSTQNLRLDVITGGLGRNSGTVSLAPSAADVNANSNTNSIWVNNTGTGGSLLKLQQSGTDVLNLSQNGGNAAAILNQTLSGDIFTASAAGVPKFVITNAGNVGIGTTTPSTPLEVTKDDATNNDITNLLTLTHTTTGTSVGDKGNSLLHMDGTNGSITFTDETAKTWTAGGSAQIDTSQSKFGGASGHFGGSGDYISTPDTPDLKLAGNDFTIDFWVRFNALPTGGTCQSFISKGTGGGQYDYWFSLCESSGSYLYKIEDWNGVSSPISFTKTSPGLSTGTWYHVAFVRSGSSWYIFQNGTQVGTTQTNSNSFYDNSYSVFIGQIGHSAYYLNGWIDEFRLTKGYARWTSNFTPPTAAYTMTGIGGGLLFKSEDEAGNAENVGRISATLTNTTNGLEASSIFFETRTGGNALTRTMSLDRNGNVIIKGSLTQSGSPDIAENIIVTDTTIAAGDIVMVDPAYQPPEGAGTYNRVAAKKSDTPYSQKLLGVISSDPGIVLNAPKDTVDTGKRSSESERPLAIAGRVPVKVSTINGIIKAGDAITASTIPGVGMKATGEGNIIGKALQDLNCENTQQTPCQGKILVLVSISWFKPGLFDPGGVTMIVKNVETGVYKTVTTMTDGTEVVADEIGAYANLIAANIRAGMIITKDFAADNYTALQGQVDNLIAKNIKTKLISPLADGTDVTVQVGSEATPSGQFIIQNATGSAVATIDSAGNATFSGKVASQKLAVDSEATISGTLYADNIKSKSLDDIQKLLTQVETDQNILLAATNAANLNATSSANLTQLAVANIYITSQAAINSLSVSQSLTIGTDLVLGSGGNTIDTLAAPLKIQSLAMAPVEIMNGLVTIDTHGNVQIAGNLAVAGKITAPAIDTETLNATGSATFSNLTIAAPDATQAAVINNGVITTNSTVGSAVVPAGVSEITIRNPRVTDYTLVYVTPTSSTQNYVLYIKNKQAGQFIVGFTNPLAIDVNFNWWIVGVANLVQN